MVFTEEDLRGLRPSANLAQRLATFGAVGLKTRHIVEFLGDTDEQTIRRWKRGESAPADARWEMLDRLRMTIKHAVEVWPPGELEGLGAWLVSGNDTLDNASPLAALRDELGPVLVAVEEEVTNGMTTSEYKRRVSQVAEALAR